MRRIIFGLILSLLWTLPVLAQGIGVSVVASCNTGVSPTFDANSPTARLTVDTSGRLCMAGIGASGYPNGSTPLTASTLGTTNATAATLAGASGVTTYVCGFSGRANATAAVTGNLTVAGTISGTLSFTAFTPANTAGSSDVSANFTPCIPASATNTAIVLTYPAPGAGGVVSVAIWGYRQ